jgi:prolyl-tRNA editing enzyme YbaK/EbsC (Cys-tRNA(Pro) deacylase)
MSVENVREYLKQWNIEDRILEFDVSSATVELAAIAAGCEPQRIAKTLSFKLSDRSILIVTAGDSKVDNRKYKDHFNKRAKMLTREELLETVGHDIGGVCPFGIKDGVEVYLDNSLKRFTTVFPACGSSNSAIELTIDELEKYSNFKDWIDVCSINI